MNYPIISIFPGSVKKSFIKRTKYERKNYLLSSIIWNIDLSRYCIEIEDRKLKSYRAVSNDTTKFILLLLNRFNIFWTMEPTTDENIALECLEGQTGTYNFLLLIFCFFFKNYSSNYNYSGSNSVDHFGTDSNNWLIVI